MDVGLLSLKWDNHSWTFSQALLNIRNKEDYCDATIACDGKFYKVHKLIMSTCSKYLEQLFDKVNLCCSVVAHPVIFLQDIKHEHLEALLDYMYVGEVNVKQTDLPLLIKAAECLKIKGLAVPDDRSSDDQSNKDRNNRKYNDDESEEKSKKNHQKTVHEKRDFGSTKRCNSENSERDMLQPSNSPSFELNGINKKRLRIDNYSQEDNLSNLEPRNVIIRNKEIYDNSQCLESSISHTEVKEEPQIGYGEDQYTTSIEPCLESNFELNNHNILKNEPLDFDNINQPHGTHQSYLDTRSATNIQTTPAYSGSQISTWESHNQSQDQTSISNSSTFFTAQHNSLPTDVNDIWQQAIQITPAGVACPFCSKVYTNRSAFRYHYKTHTGEKPYSCPHCPQRFILRGDMMKHIKIHTGEKPFSCPHCSHTFIQKSNMKDHIYRHHPEANMPAPKRCIVMNSKS